MQNISFGFATAYPGTQLYDRIMERGMVQDERDYILTIKGAGDPEPVLCDLSPRMLRDFAAGVKFKVNDLYFKAQGRTLKRALNLLVNNKYSRTMGQGAPPWIKDAVRGIIG